MALREDPELNELAALARAIPSFTGLHVLEIGCGTGRLTSRYAAGAASVIAIDPDDDDVEELRRTLPHVDARSVGIDALELPAASVDVALFAWSL